MVTNKMPKNAETYCCKKCNFECSKKSNFTHHEMTAKHKRVTNGYLKNTKTHQCDCGKEYRHKQGLSRHRQTCKETRDKQQESSETTRELLMNQDNNIMIHLVKHNNVCL